MYVMSPYRNVAIPVEAYYCRSMKHFIFNGWTTSKYFDAWSPLPPTDTKMLDVQDRKTK